MSDEVEIGGERRLLRQAHSGPTLGDAGDHARVGEALRRLCQSQGLAARGSARDHLAATLREAHGALWEGRLLWTGTAARAWAPRAWDLAAATTAAGERLLLRADDARHASLWASSAEADAPREIWGAALRLDAQEDALVGASLAEALRRWGGGA
jgi:hypothetical protein